MLEIDIDNKVYGCAVGFGNVMKIQSIVAKNLNADFAAEYEGADIESLTMEDLKEEHRASLMNNMALMPEVLAVSLRTVDGVKLQDILSYINEELDASHGLQIFNSLLSHINGMLVPKGQVTPSAQQ